MNIIELTKKAVELAAEDERLREKIKDTVTSIVMVLKNDEEHSFTLAVNRGKLEFLEEGIADPDFRFEISEEDYSNLMTGKTSGMVLMATNKMKMTKGSWAEIGKIAAPLGMIPKAGKEIAAKEESKAATPPAAADEKVLKPVRDEKVSDGVNVLAKVRRGLKQRMKGKSARHVQSSGEGLKGVIATDLARDTSELKRVEEERAKAEAEAARATGEVIQNMPDPLIVLDLDGKIVFINPAHTRMLGLMKPEEIVGRSFDELGEFLKAEDIGTFLELLGELIETGHVEPVETVLRAKDGREIPTSVTYSLIKDAEGNPRNIIASLRDITETRKLISEIEDARNRLEDRVKERTAELEEAKAFSEGILSSMADAVVTIDLDGHIVSANPALTRMFGREPEEAIGQDFSEMVQWFKPEGMQKAVETFGRAIETGMLTSVELTALAKDGKEIPISVTGGVIKDAKGNPKNIVISIRDITEHKRAEEALKDAYLELTKKSERLERFHRLTVDRELEMVKLKEEINTLLEKLGQPKKYEAPDKI